MNLLSLFFVCGFLFTQISNAHPLTPEVVQRSSAELLLSQIRAMQRNDTTLTSRELKVTLRDELEEIQRLDNSDSSNLPDEIASWKNKVQVAEDELVQQVAQQQKLTTSATTQKNKCEVAKKESVDVMLRVQRVEQEVEEENQLYLKEKSKFDENVAAIENDVETLNKVNAKLVDAAVEAAKSSSIDPLPIQHQVNILVSSLQNELESALSNLRLDWKLTETRLNTSSGPVREELRKSEEKYNSIKSDIEICQNRLTEIAKEISQIEEKIEISKKNLQETKKSLDAVQPAFDKRHKARLQRIEFLENVLNQLENLHAQNAHKA